MPTEGKNMKIALCQMRMSEDSERNCQKALEQIALAAEAGARLILFPDVQLSPFFPQYEGLDASRYVVTWDSPVIGRFCEACRESKIYASPNFYIEKDGRRYDMSLLIDDQGTLLGGQKMVHIAQAACFYEQDYYTPSEEGFKVFDTALGKIGIVVCFDRHYPESIRTEALKYVNASVVAVIMPFSSVVTGVVAVCVGKDVFAPRLLLGGLAILTASILSGVGDARESKRNDTE